MSSSESESRFTLAERQAVDYYQDYAVGTLAASMAARQLSGEIRAVSDESADNLEDMAFGRLQRANRRLAKVQITPVSEAEFVADALLLHLAHQEEIQAHKG